tara:strand:+ start:37889 stop:38851 length:963 start_codon:yes stop_codon:yes gene_type:complete
MSKMTYCEKHKAGMEKSKERMRQLIKEAQENGTDIFISAYNTFKPYPLKDHSKIDMKKINNRKLKEILKHMIQIARVQLSRPTQDMIRLKKLDHEVKIANEIIKHIQEDIINAQNKGQQHDAYDQEMKSQQNSINDFQKQIDKLKDHIKKKKEKGNIPVSLGKSTDNKQAFSHFDTAVDMLFSNITGKKGKMDDILKNVERLKIQDLNRRLNNTIKEDYSDELAHLEIWGKNDKYGKKYDKDFFPEKQIDGDFFPLKMGKHEDYGYIPTPEDLKRDAVNLFKTHIHTGSGKRRKKSKKKKYKKRKTKKKRNRKKRTKKKY